MWPRLLLIRASMGGAGGREKWISGCRGWGRQAQGAKCHGNGEAEQETKVLRHIWSQGAGVGATVGQRRSSLLNQRKGGEEKWRVGEEAREQVLPFIELSSRHVRQHQQVVGGKVSILGGHFWHFPLRIKPWSEYKIFSLIYTLQFLYRTWGDSDIG
jgi:hypothetical protein